ncbi:peptidoglycan-binding domain-containing protein, partial [Vallitalea sediminicola]
MTVVKKGDSGSNVTSLQYLLKSKGYNLSADGIFGSGTKSIVKNFQASNGLVSDGIVGEQTWL